MFREQPDVFDKSFHFPINNGNEEGTCVLRVFHNDSQQPVVVVQSRSGGVVFSSSLMENIATMVVHRFDLNPRDVIWLENHGWGQNPFYHPEHSSWARVFLDWERDQARHPSRALISKKRASEYIRRDRRRIPGFKGVRLTGA